MADVPESVSRSIRIASEATRKRLYPAASISRWRSSRVAVRMGSTLLMRNGSIIGRLGMRKVESPCRHYHNLADRFGETNGYGPRFASRLSQTSPRKLLFQGANITHQVLHLFRRQCFVGRHPRGLSLGDDFAQICVAQLLNIGGGHVRGLHRFLAFAVGALAAGTLGLERRFSRCRIGFRRRAKYAPTC